ncbi:MAG: DNA cytosine methyltransferase, partial [Proteobacteria bacterium]|nr:DNA cytosine methyltransferase [Pseudomonadota bacterium]
NEPVARVFAHHWPDAPNLGDITTIDWNAVEPVDVLCGGFPCQDVSTVGKMAGLKPGTRSGLWAHMARAIDALQPEYVVIENVRGLLTAPAIRATLEGDDDDRRNPEPATPSGATVRGLEPDPWGLGDQPARSLRALGAVLGDLADLGYDAQWLGLPTSAIGAPHPRFRVFMLARRILPNTAGIRVTTGQRVHRTTARPTRDDHAQPSGGRARDQTTAFLSGDNVRTDRGVLRRGGRYAPAIAQWERITGRPAPAPATLTKKAGLRPAPAFAKWLMGLDAGWVTDGERRLSHLEQLTALGNGVLPCQASEALRRMLRDRVTPISGAAG